MIELIHTLLNIATFQGIVIGLILLNSPFFKSKANRYLAFALFSLSWSLLNLVLDSLQTFDKYPFLKLVDIIDSAVLFPVLILLFVIHQVDCVNNRPKNVTLLFLPLLFSIIYSLLEEIQVLIQKNDSLYFMDTINNILGGILFLINLFFIPYILIKTYKSIQYSKDKQEKNWLKYLWLFEVVFLTSWLMALLLSLFVEYETTNLLYIIAFFTSTLTHWVAYFGVYKLKLANDQRKIRSLILIQDKISDSSTTPSESIHQVQAYDKAISIPKVADKFLEENIYYKKLESLCSKQKIYRDSTLDRNKVAAMLDISPSYVSQLINSITGENFSTYINKYRVEEVKKLILNEEFNNYNLLSIGLECGFSSKTTYYNWFKKVVGMTPNQYRKKHE